MGREQTEAHSVRPIHLHYRIQHVPGREAPLARLLERLSPAVEVVTDYEHETLTPNPMRGYLKCLANPPADATHLAIIQDDALPCEGFTRTVTEAISERPDDVISLFVGGLPSRTKKDFLAALKRGDRWSEVYFREIHHVVALVWPVELVNSFLAWYENARVPGPRPPRSDDAVVGFWARKTHNRVWATVPCLVEHPDDFPSTIHPPSRLGDQGRKAIAFKDDLI